MQPKAKAIETGNLTDEEIENLSDEELMNLYHTMKRHADFETNQVDFKHAMHLVRLLRMGREALTTGEIIVKRPDAQELLDIRAGAWKYNDIVKYAENLDEEVRTVLYKNTELRKKPDIEFAATLLMEVQELVWSGSGVPRYVTAT